VADRRVLNGILSIRLIDRERRRPFPLYHAARHNERQRSGARKSLLGLGFGGLTASSDPRLVVR